MHNIGIIGAGVAGLHLGLRLQQHGIAATIYTDTSAAQHATARLPNIVVRSAPTIARERQLGVNHWDTPAANGTCIRFAVPSAHPLAFAGMLDQPISIVDMRIYCAQLLDDFATRGGHVIVGAVGVDDLEALTAQHDLVVVAAGRGKFATLFPRLPEHSPFERPQRLVVCALFRGIARPPINGFDLVVVPGQGEILILPLVSFAPHLTGVAFETIAGGAFDKLRHCRYEDDPAAFNATVLDLLRSYAPHVAARINAQAFGVAHPQDQMAIAITPTVRRAYAQLPNGRPVLAVGDAHVVNDPVTGQGANTAVHAAWVVGDAIRSADTFTEPWCRSVEHQMWTYTKEITAACNARLGPPAPHMGALMAAAAHHQPLADAFANAFNTPNAWWNVTSSPERTAAFLAQHGWHGMPATGVLR